MSPNTTRTAISILESLPLLALGLKNEARLVLAPGLQLASLDMTTQPVDRRDVVALADVARPIACERDRDELVDRLGRLTIVALGEASTGTHEFQRERAAITRRLVSEHGFGAVALTADATGVSRVDAYVRGQSDDREAEQATADLAHFPGWRWRNPEMHAFLRWLRAENQRRGEGAQVGVVGLDPFASHAAVAALLADLDAGEPDTAVRLRLHPRMFAGLADATTVLAGGAVGLLARAHADALASRMVDCLARAGTVPDDAASYFRALVCGTPEAFTLRARHMAEALDRLSARVTEGVVVWSHDLEVGDARATSPALVGLGELLRVRHGNDVALVGFSTSSGTVTAASFWDGPVERKPWLSLPDGGCSLILHALPWPNLWLPLAETGVTFAPWGRTHSVGAVMPPASVVPEVKEQLCERFDFLIHVDDTRALVPLAPTAAWIRGERT